MKKPGAFKNYRYREELFPTSRFRLTYDYFKTCHGRRASKEYLKVLHLAAYNSEEKVDKALILLLATETGFKVEDIQSMIAIDDREETRGHIVSLNNSLDKGLQRLQLRAVRETYEKIARQATKENLSYEQYLHILVEKELGKRLAK